ncbi:MAG TPA: transglycosylase SLT domain-containing protein [Candidatus Binatia bacterium]|nr:transglycosylase SLT domain-containing protein [Candidatus Binatia bacterium]
MLLSVVPARAEDAGDAREPFPSARLFPRPASMEPQVRFWKSIFADYSIHQVVLHDALYLDKVYKVLDFRRHLDDGLSEAEVDRIQRIDTDLELARLRATLLRLHGLGPKPEGLTAEEQKIWDLFKDDASPDRFLAAADDKRLRAQRGLRERFAEGVRVFQRYRPEMERIFRDEGLPLELTRLPLIESCFNLHANSKVGAAGVWQFMPATGRLFMRVDHIVDERRDPLHSTRAAAAFLREIHDDLDTWPLAITAYNHGPDGIARAVRELGTNDIATIVRAYHGRAFGFASRNFYAEFLAALDVERNYRLHFGALTPAPPLRAREHRLEHPLGFEAACRLAKADEDEIAELNPALSRLVLTGRRPIPRGYRLRIPEAAAPGFETRLAELDAETQVTRVASSEGATSARVRPAVLTYKVKRTRTTHVAKRHKTTTSARHRTTGRAKKAKHGRRRPPTKLTSAKSAT